MRSARNELTQIRWSTSIAPVPAPITPYTPLFTTVVSFIVVGFMVSILNGTLQFTALELEALDDLLDRCILTADQDHVPVGGPTQIVCEEAGRHRGQPSVCPRRG